MASILKVNTIQDATNSNTAMTIDSTGRILTPARPSFRAQPTSEITNQTSGDIVYGEAGANDEANQTVELVTNAPIPVGGTLELLSGNKVVMETTDTLSLTASGAADIALSIMEIT